MANIELVIKIPEEEYKCVQITGYIGNKTCISNAIYNAKLLPKEHGRLIDEDALEIRNITVLYGYDWECGENTYADMEVVRADDIWNTPTIIEADKGERNDSCNKNKRMEF